MPTYVYACDKCETKIEIVHSIKSEDKYFCEKCKTELYRVPVMPFYVINKDGGYQDYKDGERKKLVYDKDRALKKRKRAFGSEAVGTPVDTPAKEHVFRKGRTLGGSQKEVNKAEFIRAVSKDNYAVEQAYKALKKR